MVVQKNISVQSHCEHHMAPIIGKAHVAYIPNERVVGLSKIARVVEIFSKRLQTQERLTVQIANSLMEALKKTIETKEAHYFSRSRKSIWHKGKTSGFTQKVIEIKIDDDQDSIWLTVDIGDGASCHVGYRSCFYRSIPLGPIDNGRNVEMKFTEKEKKFDPEKVYKGQPNPTKI